ncbi:hypothetical protein CCC_04020 [Paramagnetospirillum magnetotacticum MS-1]|uniref:Uncharacterized protein n=1 Tax=Paramagnetospirillum magnetotacticum MS-1 TaxID=272627 RepID=A0A0C2YID9_PARME|nr:hypothetical protein [Paramagnetospirillum magnetotacticum]KIL99504.1 hypothetical protein CCC_04020 [Paramagnetospirillum magnetotacticum MS-1]
MTPPPFPHRCILDSIGGTLACGLALSLVAGIALRLMALGHP